MDYKVLYRKYRPQNFDEVVGQDSTVKLLKDSIIENKISHAYIFSGPRGTGKTSTAKIFAKTINCSCPKNGIPCGECDNCRNYKQSSDIYEIDAASNNGVDQIREIIDNVKLSPVMSKYKVYIIDEVHMLSTSAFNALLLTLEEPPSHAVFILATTNIESVPITILSRCQRLDFKKISTETIIKQLKNISKKEKIDITDEAVSEIAYCADGGLRDALSILDQLSKKDCKITDEVVLDTIGVISNKNITDLIDSIEDNNVDKIINFIDNSRNIAVDYKSLIRKLIDNIRNKCILIKQNKITSNIGYGKYKQMCFELANTLYKSNVNIDSYEMLELILLDYVNNLNYVNNDSYVNKNDYVNLNEEKKKVNIINEKDVEANVLGKNPKNEVEEKEKNYFPGNNFELVDIRVNNCFAKAKKTKLNEHKPNWEKYISNNKTKNLKGLLMDTDIVLASDDIIVIKTELEENAQLLNEKLLVISEEYNKMFDTQYKFIAVNSEYWQDKTNEYKDKLAKGIKYTIMEEPKDNENSNILDDVFSIDKVEIK